MIFHWLAGLLSLSLSVCALVFEICNWYRVWLGWWFLFVEWLCLVSKSHLVMNVSKLSDSYLYLMVILCTDILWLVVFLLALGPKKHEKFVPLCRRHNLLLYLFVICVCIDIITHVWLCAYTYFLAYFYLCFLLVWRQISTFYWKWLYMINSSNLLMTYFSFSHPHCPF